jgi:hypothetical protein
MHQRIAGKRGHAEQQRGRPAIEHMMRVAAERDAGRLATKIASKSGSSSPIAT